MRQARRTVSNCAALGDSVRWTRRASPIADMYTGHGSTVRADASSSYTARWIFPGPRLTTTP
ncbi:hypothetical protein [Actinomadura fulvescens]|uniref:hypothetical protein n=1 Tax=Actinomadura fulvescens TaxID=46160 RepID=UPI0031E19114